MNFFNRRRADGAGTGAGAGTGHVKHHDGHAHDTLAYPMATWLKVTWLDIVTMICMGAIGLGVSLIIPSIYTRIYD